MSISCPLVYDDDGRKATGFRGKTGDCVTRSIAIATRLSYRHVYALLNGQALRELPTRGWRSSARNGVFRQTCQRVLESLGWRWVRHGAPEGIKETRSLGLGLDQKAIEAVEEWRWKPGMKGGKPVSVMAEIEVNFRVFKRFDCALRARAVLRSRGSRKLHAEYASLRLRSSFRLERGEVLVPFGMQGDDQPN